MEVTIDEVLAKIFVLPLDEEFTYEVMQSVVYAEDRDKEQEAFGQAMDPSGSGEVKSSFRVSPLDVAILDINLGNEADSTDYADQLIAAGTPFLFLSGYGSAAPLDERFVDITRLRKPVSEAALMNAVQSLLNAD